MGVCGQFTDPKCRSTHRCASRFSDWHYHGYVSTASYFGPSVTIGGEWRDYDGGLLSRSHTSPASSGSNTGSQIDYHAENPNVGSWKVYLTGYDYAGAGTAAGIFHNNNWYDPYPAYEGGKHASIGSLALITVYHLPSGETTVLFGGDWTLSSPSAWGDRLQYGGIFLYHKSAITNNAYAGSLAQAIITMITTQHRSSL